jgi:hypothetical protein
MISYVKNEGVNLHGHVTLDKKAAEIIGQSVNTVGQGLNTIGTQIGLGATMVGVSTAVGKTIAKSSMPPLQKAGIIVGGALTVGFGHSIITTINRNKISAEISSKIIDNSSVNKLVNDSALSSLQTLLIDIEGLNIICLSLVIILCIQISFKFYVKDTVTLNLSSILGANTNNKLEFYLNKIIYLNKTMSHVYI